MSHLYTELTFPPAPQDRPYVFINVVTTLDGKIVTGERTEPVFDLGSKLDHHTMRVIQEAADAIIMGAGTVRSTTKMRLPEALTRYCVTESGAVDPEHPFFSGYENYLIRTEKAEETEFGFPEIRAGRQRIDWVEVLRIMRHDHGVERLLCEGGSDLNASLLELDLVDEIFMTLAPKIKLGKDVPTLADGHPLPRTGLLNFNLISCQPEGDEVFLRYRRHHQPA